MFELLIFVSFIVVTFFTKSYSERRQYTSIEKRENALISQPLTNDELDIEGCHIQSSDIESSYLVKGHVVFSVDYFSDILSGITSIFGGRVHVLEKLADRAKREAILRMREQSPEADMIINVRIDTAQIDIGNTSKVVEVIAYGTAVKMKG